MEESVILNVLSYCCYGKAVADREWKSKIILIFFWFILINSIVWQTLGDASNATKHSKRQQNTPTVGIGSLDIWNPKSISRSADQRTQMRTRTTYHFALQSHTLCSYHYRHTDALTHTLKRECGGCFDAKLFGYFNGKVVRIQAGKTAGEVVRTLRAVWVGRGKIFLSEF